MVGAQTHLYWQYTETENNIFKNVINNALQMINQVLTFVILQVLNTYTLLRAQLFECLFGFI